MANEPLTWLLTYALHSTLLLGGAWAFSLLVPDRARVLREVAWKVGLVGAFATATIQVATDSSSPMDPAAQIASAAFAGDRGVSIRLGPPSTNSITTLSDVVPALAATSPLDARDDIEPAVIPNGRVSIAHPGTIMCPLEQSARTLQLAGCAPDAPSCSPSDQACGAGATSGAPASILTGEDRSTLASESADANPSGSIFQSRNEPGAGPASRWIPEPSSHAWFPLEDGPEESLPSMVHSVGRLIVAQGSGEFIQ